MLVQGLVRALMILACVSPSLLCFTLVTYLIAHHVDQGWGWLMVIGLMSREKLIKIGAKVVSHARNHDHQAIRLDRHGAGR